MKLNKIILLTCLCAFSAQAAAHEGNWCQRKWGAFKSLFHRHHRGPVQTTIIAEIEEKSEAPIELTFANRFQSAQVAFTQRKDVSGLMQLMESDNKTEAALVVQHVFNSFKNARKWAVNADLSHKAQEVLCNILPSIMEDTAFTLGTRLCFSQLAFEQCRDSRGLMMIMQNVAPEELSFQGAVAYVLENPVHEGEVVGRAVQGLHEILGCALKDDVRRRFEYMQRNLISAPQLDEDYDTSTSDDDTFIVASCSSSTPDDRTVSEATWGPKKTYASIAKSNSVLFHSTLFPKKGRVPNNISAHERAEQAFLKRLLVFLTLAPLRYSPEQNGAAEYEWKKELSLALGHGGRIVFEVARHDSLIPNSQAVMRALFGGSPHFGKLDGVEKRAMASHGLRLNKEGRLEEIQDFSITQSGTHYGYNFSFGGIGNVDINGNVIGPRGTRYKDGKKLKNVQHGHVYIYGDTFKNASGLLIGFESSAPGKTNMMGVEHNILSPFTAQSSPSITGGAKKKDLLLPSDLGCYRVMFSSQKFMQILNVADYLMTLPMEHQQDIFMYMLENSPELSREMLFSHADIRAAYSDPIHLHLFRQERQK